MRLWAVLLLAAAVCAGEVVETAHYRIEHFGARAEAEEAGRVLEAGWTAFQSHFKTKPKSGKDKLRVRVLPDSAAFKAALEADGVPTPDAGGYYHPENRTAYLFRQPTEYFSRVLLLHEAAHQFHYLARTRNKNPVAEWYREGIAEFLSWHHWDGETLEAAVLPLVSLKDYAAAALAEAKADDFDLEALVEGETAPSRAFAWTLVRYLATGRDGKPLRGYARFARKMDGGVKPTPLFWRTFGRPPAFEEAFVAWLEEEQQPWVQVFNEWQGLGPGRLRGFAEGVVSVCRLRGPVELLKATLEVPRERTNWRGGALLHYVGDDDYSIAILNLTGQLRITRRVGGRWRIMEQGEGPPPSKDGNYRFEVLRRRGKVYLMFEGGLSYGPWELPGETLGLAIQNSDLRFRDLSWQ